jgi:nucleotide-binding universal stress UspA family protein
MNQILVGVDFSPGSDAAVRQALRIARHTGATVCLAHTSVAPDTLDLPDERVFSARLDADRSALEELRNRIGGGGVQVSHVVADGFADVALVQLAGDMGADLIVVGTHGRTGLRRFLLGSIAERVVRLAGCPVLVARPGSDGAGGYPRILLPTDFSEATPGVLETALEVAAPGATIDLLHCWQLPPMPGPTYGPVKAAQELDAETRRSGVAAARAAGMRLIDRYADRGAALSLHVLEDAAAHGIQAWLETHPYDLVVTGSHGRRGVRRFLLGSVAELTVRHSPCSVGARRPWRNPMRKSRHLLWLIAVGSLFAVHEVLHWIR